MLGAKDQYFLPSRMQDSHALLVLSEPPQSIAWDDLHLALWPTLEAVVDRLHQAADSADIKASLDIALPVTRIWREAFSFAELRKIIGQILSCIYQMLNVECQRPYLPSAEGNSRPLEVTVILVYERSEHEDDHDTIPRDHAKVLPLAFQDLKTFARGSRPWSRVFQVDSMQGDRIYRKLREVAGINAMHILHEKVERLPAGIQMYIPKPTNSLPASPMTPESNFGTDLYREIVVNVENGSVTLADKVSLTTALILPTTEGEENMKTKSERGTLTVMVEGESRGEAGTTYVVVEFLEALLGSQLSQEAKQLRFGSIPRWEAVMRKGPVLAVESRKTVDVVVIPILSKNYVAMMPGQIQGWGQMGEESSNISKENIM